MKIAALQFSISPNLFDNFQKIKNAIIEAAARDSRLLITQEAALCGYPPIEIPSVDRIDFKAQQKLIAEIIELAARHNIFIALGLIRKDNGALFNSIMLITPDGSYTYYDKRALWGWDLENYMPGENQKGIIEIDGIRIGFRLCFEIRFPEYFRELYAHKVDIAAISFCEVSKKQNTNRLAVMKSHLITRAIENAVTVISVNGTTFYQTAPTCVVNPDGVIETQAPLDAESILYYDFVKPEPGFGRKGRIFYSNKLVGG
ncbi:MAG: carbon-nitrogen hydrolase family protein [Desulfobacter sp.]|nr:MAG: carbon-nitrogen hydrolase family protein [Desulfobacter sp.]